MILRFFEVPMLWSRHLALLLAFGAFVALTGCASTSDEVPETAAEQAEVAATNDPIEPFNRGVFEANDFLDRLFLRPLAELYRVTFPPGIRDRISNMLKNMSEPVVLANNLLQGEGRSAGITLSRLMINSTAGVGGMFEVANDFDLQQQQGDFGQTLYVWGVGEGPYLVLPLFGPSNVRDAVGLGVDTLISPWKYAVASGGTTIQDTFTITDITAEALSKREENIEALDALRNGSLDFYAQMRSVYRQHRAKEVGEPMANEMPKFEDYDSDSSSPIVH